VDGVLEDWFGEDTRFGRRADYWMARPDGYFFLLRDYQEDSEMPGVPSGTAIDLALPIWRVGECLRHASRTASALDASRVEFMMRWDGLEGRMLEALASPDRFMRPCGPAGPNSVGAALEVYASVIEEHLPDVVRHLVEPLYAAFGFFEPSAEIYVEEISKMKRPV